MAIPVLAAASGAMAQPLFFDDFDGAALLPHWQQPDPSWWQYNVTDSRLNVTALLFPSIPPDANYAILSAENSFADQADVQFDIRMGWGPAEFIGDIEADVLINGGGLATIGCKKFGDQLRVFAAAGPNLVSIPAPAPGIYDFRISRSGSVFSFSFDGAQFAQLADVYGYSVNGFDVLFSAPYPGTSAQFFLDRVQVVPGPGAAIGPAIALCWCLRRPPRPASRVRRGFPRS